MSGQVVTDPALIAQLEAASQKHGDDYLNTLDPARAAQIRAMATGRMQLPQGTLLKSPYGQQLMADLSQAYPGQFSAADEPSQVAARKAFTSGKQGQNIIAFNTALSHLASLAQAGEELHNTSFTPLNSVKNWVSSTFGQPETDNFNTIAGHAAGELASAFRAGGQGNEADVKRELIELSSSNSPQEIRGVIASTAKLLAGKIQAMQQSYNTAMNTTVSQPLPMLQPHAIDALNVLSSPDYLQHGYSKAIAAAGLNPNDPGNPTPPSAGAPPNGPNGGPPGTPPGTPPGAPPTPMAVASGATRMEHSDQLSAMIDSMVNSGASMDQINAKMNAAGYPNIDPDQYQAAMKWRAENPGAVYHGGDANRVVPNSLLNQLSGSAIGSGLAGAADAATFGTLPKIVAGVDALGQKLGGTGTASLGDLYNANLAADQAKLSDIESVSPAAALVGKIGGTLVGMGAGGAALKAIPGVGGIVSAIPEAYAPVAGDAAYGAAYGAGSSNNLNDAAQNAALGSVLGAGTGALGRGLASGVAGLASPIVSGAAQRLTDAGITLTPGQLLRGQTGFLPRVVTGLEDAMTGNPGSGTAIDAARANSVKDFNLALLREKLAKVGETLPDDAQAGFDTNGMAMNKVSDAYGNALGGINGIVPDDAYMADMDNISSQVGKLVPSARDQFNSVIARAVTPYLPQGGEALSGDALQNIKKGLDQQIATYGKSTASPLDNDVADQLSNMRDAYLGLVDRQAPESAQDYADARDAWRGMMIFNNAAKNTKDGIVTPNQYLAAVRNQKFGVSNADLAAGTAPYQQLASDASQILPSTLGQSGTAPRLMAQRVAGMAIPALGGAGIGYGEDGGYGALAGLGAGAALGSMAYSPAGLKVAQTVLAGDRGPAMTSFGDWLRANQGVGSALTLPATTYALAPATQ